MNRLKLIVFLSILVSSKLFGEEAKAFNFYFEDNGQTKSISGYRMANGDDTDNIQVYNPSSVTYRLLVDGGSGLAVPSTIQTYDFVYLEITTFEI